LDGVFHIGNHHAFLGFKGDGRNTQLILGQLAFADV
jgi:hypothetical protein